MRRCRGRPWAVAFVGREARWVARGRSVHWCRFRQFRPGAAPRDQECLRETLAVRPGLSYPIGAFVGGVPGGWPPASLGDIASGNSGRERHSLLNAGTPRARCSSRPELSSWGWSHGRRSARGVDSGQDSHTGRPGSRHRSDNSGREHDETPGPRRPQGACASRPELPEGRRCGRRAGSVRCAVARTAAEVRRRAASPRDPRASRSRRGRAQPAARETARPRTPRARARRRRTTHR
jgi:hypothetical protein